MARTQGMVAAIDEVMVTETAVAGTPSRTDWAAIFGGALGAIAVSIILFTAGSGFGLSTVEPWSFANRSPAEFAIGAGIWLIVMQWLSSAFGGYLAGRLRTKWVGVRTDEVLFRDTAHGMLAWALATVIVAALFALGTTAATTAAIGTEAASDAAQAAAAAAEQARVAAAKFSIFTAISLLIGGFIGAVAGALGGYHRDEV